MNDSQVYDHWAEKGISGFTVFKYKLRRLAEQPILTTEQVHNHIACVNIVYERALVATGRDKAKLPILFIFNVVSHPLFSTFRRF